MTIPAFGWRDNQGPALSAANLEAMLAAAGAYIDSRIASVGSLTTTTRNVSGTTTLAVGAGGGAFADTWTGNVTYSAPTGAVAGTECVIDLFITSDLAGGHTGTWPGSVAWIGNVVPPPPVYGQKQLVTLVSTDGGTTWLGSGPGNYIPPSLLTAKGDLIVASSAGVAARLPVGTNGQVLIADSSQSLGVRWGTAGSSNFDGAVLADNPVMYLTLSETSGTVAADATGNGHTGTYTGGFTLGQTGPCSDGKSAVLLDGTSGYVTVPDTAPLRLVQPLSIEFWTKFTDFAAIYMVVGKSDGVAANGYQVEAFNTTGNMVWANQLGANTQDTRNTSGVWNHWVITDNGTNVIFYFNGTAVSSGAQATPVTNTLPVLIGHRVDGYWFKGAIAKVALYNTVLSAARVSAHYAAR